jgi:hypothetical protein
MKALILTVLIAMSAAPLSAYAATTTATPVQIQSDWVNG